MNRAETEASAGVLWFTLESAYRLRALVSIPGVRSRSQS